MRHVIKSIFLSILCAFAASCGTEPTGGGPGMPDDADRATITFNVRAPGLSRGGATRAFPAGFEDDIADITIFLAHDDGAGFTMDSMIVVDRFRPVSATTQAFTLQLPVSAIPTKVFVVANLMDADNSLGAIYGAGFTTANGKGSGEDDFIRSLADNWAEVGGDGTGAVCMYMAGSAVLPRIAKGGSNLHIPLLRWVARADVNIDLGADSKSFVPTGVTSWHGYRDACVFAGAAAYDTENAARVLTPTLANVARLAPDSHIDVPVSGTEGVVATAYVGEHDGVSAYEDKLDAPCLVLGGYFDGSPTESFYRIDFDSGLDGHPFGQVLRNWQYVFNVTKIMSAGYDTPAEAAANPAHSIVVEVEMWDENVQQINFVGTGDYMYVNTLDAQLNYNQGAQNTFVVRSTIPFEWGFDTADVVDESSDATLADANFSVGITARDTTATATYTDYTFTVTTLAENISNVRNEAAVFISAKNALMSVKLTQRAESITDRVINVLSFTDDIGSMGVYYENGTMIGGNEMRNILNNPAWFGPTGVVKCGGFTFDQFNSGDILPTSNVSLDKLRRMLGSTDILVTTYSSDPPQEVVDIILEWNRKPYHVLFVAADAGGTTPVLGDKTNVILRESLKNSPFFNSGLTWYNILDLGTMTGTNTTTSTNNPKLTAALGSDYLRDMAIDGGFVFGDGEPVNASSHAIVMADQTDKNLTFMAGPFGLPDQGMLSITGSYKIWDDYAELAVPSATSPVTPLLVLKANVFGYNSNEPVIAKTDMMMIGVDIAHTTVYLGENQHLTGFLTMSPPLGFTPGLVNSPYYNSLSVLMSNIWGWAVKNVLAQVREDD